MEVYYRKSGDQVYARVFSDAPFRWEVRFKTTAGIGNLENYSFEVGDTVTPVDGRADLPPIVLQQPPESVASYMLFVMPLNGGDEPMDGSEEDRPDHRRFWRLR